MRIRTYDDVTVRLVGATPDPAKVVRFAVGITQKRAPEWPADGASAGLCRFLLSANHGSVLEHVSYTLLVAGASRSFLAQATRHRIASFTSGSQHYQDHSDFDASVHPSMAGRLEVTTILWEAREAYRELVRSGVPIHEARQVLPNACANNLLVTINARSLVNFLNLRLCRRNTEEIRTVAGKIIRLARGHFPELFGRVGPDCLQMGACSQGRMSCGRPVTKEEDESWSS
jgi:thymidylate synthase (FAD)